jgi:hypothetical protein
MIVPHDETTREATVRKSRSIDGGGNVSCSIKFGGGHFKLPLSGHEARNMPRARVDHLEMMIGFWRETSGILRHGYKSSVLE